MLELKSIVPRTMNRTDYRTSREKMKYSGDQRTLTYGAREALKLRRMLTKLVGGLRTLPGPMKELSYLSGSLLEFLRLHRRVITFA